MKKILLSLFAFLCVATFATAQINYSNSNFSNSSGTYTDLGTNGSAVSFNGYDDSTSAPVNIGFNFTYNGTTYSQITINTNGFIKFGSGNPSTNALFYSSSNSTTNGIFNSGNSNDFDMVAAFNHDLEAASNPEIRTYTSGTSPNRVMTIQWEGMRDKAGLVARMMNYMEFQIKLYETSGTIEIIYGTWTSNSAVSNFKSAAVGLKGTSNSNSQIRAVTKGSTQAWSAASCISGNYTGNSHNWGNSTSPNRPLPDAGRTYKFLATFDLDCAVSQVYTLGEVPLIGTPHVVRALVKNNGTSTVTNVPVSLSITGANTFSDNQTISSLASGASTVVTFATWSPTNVGASPIEVQVSNTGDPLNVNDSIIINTNITDNRYSYKYPSVSTPINVGFNGAYGSFVAKFSCADTIAINQVKVDFNSSNQPYRIRIYGDNNNDGIPDTLRYESPSTLLTAVGQALIPICPKYEMPTGNFFVGVAQYGSTNVGFASATEAPIRQGNFYYYGNSNQSIGLSTLPTFDFYTGTDFRLAVEVEYELIPNAVPNCAVPQTPADGSSCNAFGVQDLIFTSGGGFPDYFDVYFGTDFTNVDTMNPANLVQSGCGTSYSANLSANTTYYWKVVPVNTVGSQTSCTWSFTTDGTSYCTPVNTTCDEFISRVRIGTIDNVSFCGNYQDFHCSLNTTLYKDFPYTLIVNNGLAYSGDSCTAYFDWNQDGDFTDSGEEYRLPTTNSGSSFSLSITPPNTASVGNTRMRIRLNYYPDDLAFDPCATQSFGETEDYAVNIQPLPPCTTAPIGGTCNGPSTRFINQASNYTISSSTYDFIQWQFSTTSSSGPWTDIVGATNASQQLFYNGLGTYYIRAIVSTPGCTSDSSTVATTNVVERNGDSEADPYLVGVLGNLYVDNGSVGTNFLNNYDASQSVAEVNGQASQDLYYLLTMGSCQDTLYIDLCNTNPFDTYVHLLDNNLNWIASSDDYCGSASYMVVPVTPGASYYVVVEGFGTSTGNYQLRLYPGELVPSQANAGPNVAVCTNTSAVLNAVAPDCGNGSWTLISGSGTIMSPNSNSTLVTNIGPGSNTFQFTVTSGSRSTTDLVDINSVPRPTGLTSGTVTASTANVSWTCSVDPDSFLVRYQKNCTGTFYYAWVAGNLRTTTLTGLDACTNYCFRVRAHCTSVALPPYSSTSGSFTTLSGASCVAVTPVSISNVSACSYLVSWNTCVTADSFRVRFKLSSASVWSFSPFTTSSSQTVTLGPGNWKYRVQTWCGGVLVASTANATINIGSCRTAGSADALVQGFIAFPNPATEFTTLNFSSLQEGMATLKVTDLTGRTIMENTSVIVTGENSLRISVNGWAKGVYSLKLSLNNQDYMTKLVVE